MSGRFKLTVTETPNGKFHVRMDAGGVCAVGKYDSLQQALKALSKGTWILNENESSVQSCKTCFNATEDCGHCDYCTGDDLD